MPTIQNCRADFPLLCKSDAPIYFDNACQSLRPQNVIDAMVDYYQYFPACAGRSNHSLARKVTQACNQSREDIARFIGAKRKEEIIFTRNTTEGLNLVAHSLDLKMGDVVLASDKEHNSNLVPWQILAEKVGIKHTIIPSQNDNTFDLVEYEKLLTPQVKLVSIVYTSNMDGVSVPVIDIIKLAHKNGSLVMLDAAQAAPHQKIDVHKLDVDFLSFSGHKMLGPSGTGVLYGKYELLEKLEPFMVGGDTVASTTYTLHEFLAPPEKYEAGLQDYAGIIGLGKAVEYLQSIGLENIHKHEIALNQRATQQLIDIPKLKIIGPKEAHLRGGILSFYIEGIDSHQIALLLDNSAHIMIRSGQHCVHSWFAAHNIYGTARASFYFYNTLEEVDIFVTELKKVISVLR